jgi:LysR family transcriptional regulator, transcriptional activator of nhaA
MSTFSYRHLHYFWVVAREGGMARGAARLGMAVQTVSAQVRELEKALGHSLLKPEGRKLVLTDAGVAAMQQADLIFELGEQLPARLQQATGTPVQRLHIGVGDGVPKLVVRRLLQPVMLEPQLRLRCDEGDFEALLADLALHRLDVVLADRPAPAHPSLRLYSHALETSPLAWYAAPTLQVAARGGFPQSLATVPVLLPTPDAAARRRLDAWFAALALRPRVVGEFEDSALLKTFGASGMGVFPAPALVHDELLARYAVKRVGACDGVEEHYYAIGTERRVHHPLVRRLLAPR